MPSFHSARDALERSSTVSLLLGLIAIHVALHAAWLDLPPAGFHLWRQTQTLSVARNFHEEGFDLLHPRVDSRGATPGATGMEFPLVNAAIGAAYTAVGFHHGLHRVVMLLLGLPAILGMMLLARGLLGSQASGFFAGALLITNPLFAYYSVTALPEIPMLGAMLLGLAGLVAWSRSLRARVPVAALASLSLAGLVKLSSVAAWPAAVLLLWRGLRPATTRRRVLTLATAVTGLAVVVAWYVWARHLSDVSGNRDFLLSPVLSYRTSRRMFVLRRVFVRWLPEVYVSYPQFVLLLIGVREVVRPGNRTTAVVLAAWGLGLVAYGTAMARHLAVHDYYMAPATPLLLLLATLGVERLWTAAERTRPAAWIAGLLIALTAVVGPWRGLSRLARARPRVDLMALEPALRDLLPEPTGLVVAASDPSPSIYLYFI